MMDDVASTATLMYHSKRKERASRFTRSRQFVVATPVFVGSVRGASLETLSGGKEILISPFTVSRVG